MKYLMLLDPMLFMLSHKMLHSLCMLHCGRLGILGLNPLELKRLRCDLIQYYKIFDNLTSLNPADYFNDHQPSLSSRAASSIRIKIF